MKKGFTLIELLAVIVILAIIAVIAVPIVLNIINDSKDSANKRSIDMYSRALELSIANQFLTNPSDISGTYTTTDGKTLTNIETKETIDVNFKGADINCNVIRIYNDGSYYLNKCKVEDKLVEDYSAGSNIPSDSIAEAIIKKYGGIDSITEIDDEWIEKEPTDATPLSVYVPSGKYYFATKYEMDKETGKFKLGGEVVYSTIDDCLSRTKICGKYTMIMNSLIESHNLYEVISFEYEEKDFQAYTTYITAKKIPSQNKFSEPVKDGESGLYKTEDIYGTSYYLRGDVTNNYVQLGTYTNNVWFSTFTYSAQPEEIYEFSTLEECESFNLNLNPDVWGGSFDCVQTQKKGEPMYWRVVRINGDGTIRLIYDGAEKVENGQNKITFTSIGQYDSGADLNWYNAYLKNDYDKYIVNSIFETDDNQAYCEYFEEGFNGCYTNSYVRFTKKSPSLKLNVTDTNSFKNKVGLITMDEVLMAGVGDNSYISTENYYLTSNLFGEYEGWNPPSMPVGSNQISYADASGIYYQKPDRRSVINLKADVKFKGDGTIGSPYEIIME